ncbi:MAG: hypothetical protein Q7V10_01805 [Methanobacteriaceae archaeon]|nr:hypothetical protein [Methanobacteriaceae archaeon]MDO9628206.1 hypothetical protein [Methanobacteriaceae archaeon]
MSRILKFIIFLVFFIVFFEVGLVSSYTIVTSQPPDIEKLMNMQVDRISAIFNVGGDVNKALTGTPDILNISNTNLVSQSLQIKAKLDGVDIKTLNATSFADQSKSPVPVNLTIMGYKENSTGGNSTGGGQIVITPSADFMITATANANSTSKGFLIDLNSIKIVSISRMYTNN